MQTMNLMILGATGNIGRQVVKLALERGHKIRAIVRSAAKVSKADGLEVIEGDVLDQASLRPAPRGMDAVISCLGIRKQDPADPWSELLSPDDFVTRSVAAIIDAMKQNGVKRLVAISSAGIGDSWEMVCPELRKVIEDSSVAKIFRDLNNMEKVLEQSGLDTLAVRPVALANGDSTGKAKIVDKFESTSKIFTGDVAQWMLDAVERPEPFDKRTEMIGLE